MFITKHYKDDATRKILQMTVYGKRNRGRPKLRWRYPVKEDMARNQMTSEIAADRNIGMSRSKPANYEVYRQLGEKVRRET